MSLDRTSFMHRSSSFESFCRQDVFKRYVRAAINDEYFWQNIIQRMQVTNMVDSHINEQVPSRVRQHLDDVLAGRVSQEILKQLPHILDNNHRMQQILAEQRTSMTETLERAGREVVERIVNEDQYHEVNQAYFDTFKRKGDVGLSNFEDRGSLAIQQMEDDCKNRLSELSERLNETRIYQDKTNELQNRLTELENQISWLRYSLYSLGAAVLAGGIWIFTSSPN